MSTSTQPTDSLTLRTDPVPPLTPDQCPFCSSTALVDFFRSRFRVACTRCEVHFELTAAAHKRAKSLPPLLLTQIRAENARGRTPCISMPDIESSAEGDVAGSGLRRLRIGNRVTPVARP
jgi:hypothetical protein